MEGGTGPLDVSWLKVRHKDNSRTNSVVSASSDLSPKQSMEVMRPMEQVSVATSDSSAPAIVAAPPHPFPHAHRPHLFGGSGERSNSVTPQSNVPTAAPKDRHSSVSSGRRGSWISSLQSKFSSATPPASPPPVPKAPVEDTSTSEPHPQPRRSSTMILPPAAPVNDSTAPYVPSPPVVKQPGFLQSALRRLSSTTVQQMGKVNGSASGGLVERRVMNVDPNRERCRIEELNTAKLRRVSFCVDVEIAAPPKYEDDGPSLDITATKKEKSKKLKEKGEGEALKNPQAVTEMKGKDGAVSVEGSEVDKTQNPDAETNEKSDKRKEKKKRSEQERKERKERKRRQAEENGSLPLELTRESPDDSPEGSPPGSNTPRSQDRPTTDPVRIYRRCCQLRESKVMINVVEQLSQPAACAAATPGIVSVLDLSGITLPLVDLVTLGDFLAVVPVKKVILENCSLGDEGLRVILAGLLSARTTEATKVRAFPHLAAFTPDRIPERYGAVEKLVLKRNTNLSKEGWKHICLFLHMSHSIKAVDLSEIPFPPNAPSDDSIVKTPSGKPIAPDILTLFKKAMSERLAGSRLEELVMSECGLTSDQIGGLVDCSITSGLRRLGIASNHLTMDGMEHVARFIRNGTCEGLDLGGNDLRELHLLLINALTKETPLYALSLADCSLAVPALGEMLPALLRLPNFRFIDLSHNHDLFQGKSTALSLLRRYLPRFPVLKRIHLCDVGMNPDDAIALAEVLPEIPSLAHLNILENPSITKLATSSDESSQEEACALYASLMAAVRVSQTIIAIDIDVPSPDSAEVVKALAKQVVAYCLRNMEQGVLPAMANEMASPAKANSGVQMPEVLMHLVGHHEGTEDLPAPEQDYIIGGTGLVKALGVCLNRLGHDSPSGAVTPKSTFGEIGTGKAKIMSANLLDSARKIRARLQPALANESKKEGDGMVFKKLLFLDQTLSGVIKRFEDEYPETRVDSSVLSVSVHDSAPSQSSPHTATTAPVIDDEDVSDNEQGLKPSLSRHDSDVSLATKAMGAEEGRIHRFGQSLRRELLKPQGEDHAHGTTGDEMEEEDILRLRQQLENLEGPEILQQIKAKGHANAMKELGEQRDSIRKAIGEEELQRLKAEEVGEGN
ncbi:MAG: hypothetical protein M1814_005517 [Vezdaea aestivalis]|nr:MAG: hypothetical protein M1814_005517 [Vezdaea aestivalis]